MIVVFFIAFVESILSETHGNRSAAEQLIYSSRMQTAIMNTIQTKQVLNHLIKHVIDSSFNGEKLMYVNSLLTKFIAFKYNTQCIYMSI